MYETNCLYGHHEPVLRPHLADNHCPHGHLSLPHDYQRIHTDHPANTIFRHASDTAVICESCGRNGIASERKSFRHGHLSAGWSTWSSCLCDWWWTCLSFETNIRLSHRLSALYRSLWYIQRKSRSTTHRSWRMVRTCSLLPLWQPLLHLCNKGIVTNPCSITHWFYQLLCRFHHSGCIAYHPCHFLCKAVITHYPVNYSDL